jgi:CRP/FNR family transcriptional regulator, nitrogen oxide reductase regulator
MAGQHPTGKSSPIWSAKEKALTGRLDKTLIAGLDAFEGLSEEDLRYILSHARVRRCEKNEIVFRQGTQADAFFVLLDGHVKAFQTTSEGQQVILRFVIPGEIFGFAVAIGLREYPGTAIALTEGVVLVWEQAFWHALISRCPCVTQNVLRTVGHRLIEQQTRVRELATKRAEARVAHVLLRCAKEAGNEVAGGIEIVFPITRQDLAEITGTTLFTVSRAISAWDRAGLVEAGRQHILVRDTLGLAQIARGAAAAASKK